MKLSVVVGTLNRLPQLRACLVSIFDQTAIPVHVWVSDAGSTDGTMEYLRALGGDRVTPIFEGRRLGQAKAYNDVFARIETPYTCWLSDDNVVVNRGLEVAVRVLDENPWIGMVGLKVKDVAGPFVDAPYIGGVSSIGILNVNQGLLRTAILKEVGGFSETFGDYGIDPDLTAKVLFSGHGVVYTRAVAIHHYRNWADDPSSPQYRRQMERQREYQELYRRKYAGMVRGRVSWHAKGLVWRLVRKLLGLRFDSTRPFLGLFARDWHNIFMSRYISVADPWRYRGESYHLVQVCPSGGRPSVLPPDPTDSLSGSTPRDVARTEAAR